MLFFPTSAWRKAWLLAMTGACAAVAISAHAEPAAVAVATPPAPVADAPALPDALANDPVARLLTDKGLLPTRAGELARHVRDTASDVASDLVLSAMNFLGVPYKRGGQSAETGFDCSGFTRYVFESTVGVVLPRRADEQARAPGMVTVARNELKPGDLVFFNTMRRAFSHVGIYIGDGKFIHSPRTGRDVRVEDMREAYWTRRFDGARRAPITASATPNLLAPLSALSRSAAGTASPPDDRPLP